MALYGGKPIRKELLPYGHHTITKSDIDSVIRVLKSDWLTSGPTIEEFENQFSKYIGSKYSVSFSSGTAALHGSIFAANIMSGDEVITTPFSFCATANCILYQNGKPIFSDINIDTLNIDPNKIENKINNRTKAILPVDFGGQPAELEIIYRIAAKNKLIVIEDACHALGASYGNKKIGNISDMTIFSFHPVKHITTGEGGMVSTNNETFYRRLKIFRNHGINTDSRTRQKNGKWFYEMNELGYNYRLTDIGSALGLSQLHRLEPIIKRRTEIANIYIDNIESIDGINVPKRINNIRHAWHLFPIVLDPKIITVGRNIIFHALRAENIGVNVHYIPIHLHPYYRRMFLFKKGDYPNSETIYNHILSLPLFPAMNDKDIEDVIAAIKKVFKVFKRK